MLGSNAGRWTGSTKRAHETPLAPSPPQRKDELIEEGKEKTYLQVSGRAESRNLCHFCPHILNARCSAAAYRTRRARCLHTRGTMPSAHCLAATTTAFGLHTHAACAQRGACSCHGHACTRALKRMHGRIASCCPSAPVVLFAASTAPKSRRTFTCAAGRPAEACWPSGASGCEEICCPFARCQRDKEELPHALLRIVSNARAGRDLTISGGSERGKTKGETGACTALGTS